MNSDKSHMPSPRGGTAAKRDGKDPEWANGLRKLYDSVVDEPLPDSFKDLLEQLDTKD
ncbi:NepR family anti-sigma factor [Qipengyuania sp. XHP0211]|uniref:NepR family anti-sigma factor n=2 Tax=Qipengyuania sp. XHP0211 TaxID=3038079 RepID=UPI0024204DA2|nr:NepR family anti-sigma factor [Qipengyuania sp. XHP0211]MDG5750337.1 NepR family anti-sigma factor [Qipengyuania sp. XHP0211]